MHKLTVGSYQVEEKGKVFEITQTDNQTTFVIFKTIASKKITLKTVETLLTKKKTAIMKGFISAKTKKTFNAGLTLSSDNKVGFHFK